MSKRAAKAAKGARAGRKAAAKAAQKSGKAASKVFKYTVKTQGKFFVKILAALGPVAVCMPYLAPVAIGALLIYSVLNQEPSEEVQAIRDLQKEMHGRFDEVLGKFDEVEEKFPQENFRVLSEMQILSKIRVAILDFGRVCLFFSEIWCEIGF